MLPADVGAAKPDRAIFDAALKRLGLGGEQVAYVGDRAGRRPRRRPAPAGLRPIDVRGLATLAELPRALGLVSEPAWRPMSDVPAPLRLARERYGLDAQATSRPCSATALARGADYADLFFERTTQDSVALEDGIVKSGDRHVAQGVGVRAQVGERQGYAHTDEITLESLRLAAGAARAIADGSGARARGGGPRGRGAARTTSTRSRPRRPTCRCARRSRCSREIDAYARARDPRIAQVMASVVSQQRERAVAASDGTLASDVQPLVRLNVQVIAEDGRGRREVGYQGGGGRVELAVCLDSGALAPARRRGGAPGAPEPRRACPARPARWTSCSAPGWPGILLHEAIGHGLEGDFNRKGTSAFADRLGQRVAAPGVTVVDDGTIAGPARLAERRRRGHADAAHRADRGRHPARLPAGPPERAPHGRGADRQRPARELRAPARCRA